MGRNNQPTGGQGLSHKTPDTEATGLIPMDVSAYISQIRALIVAGNLKKASKSLDSFRVRFGGKWLDLYEIKEIEAQITRLKVLTGK